MYRTGTGKPASISVLDRASIYGPLPFAASHPFPAVYDRPRADYQAFIDALLRDRPGSGRAFIADLREFISRRLEGVDPYRESEEYRREQERASRLYEKLREMLSERGRKLLLAYSEAAASARSLETEILAERAFLEGVRLMVRAMEKGSGDGG